VLHSSIEITVDEKQSFATEDTEVTEEKQNACSLRYLPLILSAFIRVYLRLQVFLFYAGR